MPKPRERSRSLRKIFKKLPGGRLGIYYARRKPNAALCASCKKPLRGTPRELPYQLRKLAKTQRRPQRMFGGVLCAFCLRRKLIALARGGAP